MQYLNMNKCKYIQRNDFGSILIFCSVKLDLILLKFFLKVHSHDVSNVNILNTTHPIHGYPGDILMWRIKVVGLYCHLVFKVIALVTVGTLHHLVKVNVVLRGTLENKACGHA